MAMLVAGCGTTTQRRNPLVVIAIITAGGGAPTSAQATQVHQAILPMLTRSGFALAETRDIADFILTVRFSPAPSGTGGHVTAIGIEPARTFRDATASGDTPEARELRQRQRELEQWINRQSFSYESVN